MDTLEQEIFDKYQQLDPDAKLRLLQALSNHTQAEFDYDTWWTEVEALRTKILSQLDEEKIGGALSALDKLRNRQIPPEGERHTLYDYDPKEVEDWLELSPDYVIIILGSAFSQEISFLYSVLGMLREDPKIEGTVLTYVGGHERSGKKAIDRMLTNIARIQQLIIASQIYVNALNKKQDK